MIVSRVLCEVHSKFHAVTASTSGGQPDDDHVDRVTPLSGTQFRLPCARAHVRLEIHSRHLDMDRRWTRRRCGPAGRSRRSPNSLTGSPAPVEAAPRARTRAQADMKASARDRSRRVATLRRDTLSAARASPRAGTVSDSLGYLAQPIEVIQVATFSPAACRDLRLSSSWFSW